MESGNKAGEARRVTSRRAGRLRIGLVLIAVLGVLEAGACMTHVGEDQGAAVAKWPFVMIVVSAIVLFGFSVKKDRLR
ncbi:hypothetical protein [Cohnella nanjingensis]|uniref:Uncharacterized protein n=1 Tax=Cohnella nanjingensis TaxID=1387779 RepID=A0A7X0VJI2_9BACL|nr:hypothetical protein [Cohnella nanjingensis]MBB6674739.1 hypothetical protein [Cohnella nanjingensis]